MTSPNRIVDHIIVMTSPAEMVEISEAMVEAGFTMGNEVIEKSLGIKCRLMPIRGGGFVELASEMSPGIFPHGDPFAVTPRIGSVFYTTDDAAVDMERWSTTAEAENAMAQAGSWSKEDGSMGYFVAAFATPPAGDLFFGLQERRLFPLPYLDQADTAPAVARVTVGGDAADLWRRRHVQLFELPEADGIVRAGETELVFEQDDGGEGELKVTFAVPNPQVTIPIVGGRFQFVEAEAK